MMRGNGRGRTASLRVAAVLAVMMLPAAPHAQKARARELGLPIGGTPGPLDAITDVAGVEVGHTTLISGSGQLVVGQGPGPHRRHRVHPRGKANPDPVFAAWFTLNGNGEMTGTTWVQESGLLEGPVAITNTHSVGVVRDAIIRWEVVAEERAAALVAAGGGRDLRRHAQRHQRLPREGRARARGARQRARAACRQRATSAAGPAWCATASRAASVRRRGSSPEAQGGYTVGVLVQCNYGLAPRAADRRRAGR